jgi:hypothetical protein
VNGVLVTPGDPGELAAALQSLIVDAERRNRLAGAAHARAGEFDIVHWREALHDVWLAAASRRRKAPQPATTIPRPLRLRRGSPPQTISLK